MVSSLFFLDASKLQPGARHTSLSAYRGLNTFARVKERSYVTISISQNVSKIVSCFEQIPSVRRVFEFNISSAAD